MANRPVDLNARAPKRKFVSIQNDNCDCEDPLSKEGPFKRFKKNGSQCSVVSEDVDMQQVPEDAVIPQDPLKITFKGTIDVPEVEDIFIEGSFASLIREAITAVLYGTQLPAFEEKIYRVIRNLCILGKKGDLVLSIKKEFKEYIAYLIDHLPNKDESKEFLVSLVQGIYGDLPGRVERVRCMASYLDQTYALNANPIADVGQEALNEALVQIRSQIVQSVMAVIRKHREGEDQKEFLGGDLSRLFDLGSGINLYKDIADQLLKSTEEYYTQMAMLMLKTTGVTPDYIQDISKRFQAESYLANYFLAPEKEALETRVFDRLFRLNVPNFSEVCFKFMDENSRDPLHWMYWLFEMKAGTVEPLVDQYYKYGMLKGTEITAEGNTEKKMGALQGLVEDTTRSGQKYHLKRKENIDRVIELERKLDNICSLCFDNNRQFTATFDRAIRAFMSRGNREGCYARLYPEYLEDLLKTDESEENLQIKVNVVLRLVKQNMVQQFLFLTG